MSRLLRQRARREAIFFLTPKNYFSFFSSHSTFGSLLHQSGHQRLENNASRTAQDHVVGLRIIVNVITVVERHVSSYNGVQPFTIILCHNVIKKP